MLLGVFPEKWIDPVEREDRQDHFSWLYLFPLLLPQVVYFTEMYKIFSELTDQIDQAGLTDEQRERETEAKLSELRALSIVADDWGEEKPKNREGLLSCLSEWIALFSGSFAAVQTDSSGLNLIIRLFPCGLINPLIPLALHSHVSFSLQKLSKAAEMPH